MSTRLKIAGALVALAVLGAGAAAVALKVFFPEPKLRAMVVDGARRQLGREVRLSGIGVGIRGLRLSGLEISERPDFSAGTFVSVQSFSLRPSWRALLRRRLVVATASAEGLRLRLVRGPAGTFNYEDLAGAVPAPAAEVAPAKTATGPAPEFNVRRLRVRGGSVEYSDRAGGSAWSVSELSLSLDDFSLSDPFAVETSLRLQGRAGKRPIDARLSFAGTVEPARGLRDKMAVEIKRLRVVVEGLELSVKGRAARPDAPELSLEASLSAASKALLELSGSGRVSPRVGGAPVVEADLTLRSLGLDTRLLARLLPEAKVPALDLPPGQASAALRWEDGRLALSALRASWSGGKIEGSGSLSGVGSAKPVLDVAARFSAELPARKIKDLPFGRPPLPAEFALPAAKLEGAVRVRGDDVTLEKVSAVGRGFSVRIDGSVAKALAGTPEPALDVAAELDLPPLTDQDLPISGVPAGLELPASRWQADLSYTSRAVRLRKLAVKIGGSEAAMEGAISDPTGRCVFDLLVKCRRFVLPELTRLTPRTRDLSLAGEGLLALSVTGDKRQPLFGGKLQFRGVGATVAGLALSDFTGTVSFDERRVDVPNLKGKLADGALRMDLTVKDYARSPEIQLEAELERFDLGRYLAAKKKLQEQAAAAKTAKAGGGPPEAKPLSAIRTRGRVEIGRLLHPNANVEKTEASWDLWGVTPDLRRLTGEAKLRIGTGEIRAVGELASQSPVVKVLVFPLLIVQKLGRIGGLRLFPDFNDIRLRQVLGDYAFKDGVMTLRESEMDSDAARVSAKGRIDLPAEALDLTVTAQVANIAPIDVSVGGTFAQPKPKLNVAKFLADPAKQLLNGLLKR